MFDGQPKEILLYEKEDGRQPFTEWLRALPDRKARAQVRKRLDRLELLGHPGDYKSLGDGLYELRIDLGPGYRLYLALSGRHAVLLLCGGDKATQQRDIERAQDYWLDYQQRQI